MLEVSAGISPISANMWVSNQSSLDDFILLGFSDRSWLETPLFVILLVAYIFALFGNISVILVSCLDPQLDSPMYFFVSNLSFLDFCFTTSTVPQMLVNLRGPEKTISYGGCVAQLCYVQAPSLPNHHEPETLYPHGHWDLDWWLC